MLSAGMTILQDQRILKDKMPVEHGRKSLQDYMWEDKFKLNTKKPDSQSNYHNHESYNNNNNVKYVNSSGIIRPRRERSLPRFDHGPVEFSISGDIETDNNYQYHQSNGYSARDYDNVPSMEGDNDDFSSQSYGNRLSRMQATSPENGLNVNNNYNDHSYHRHNSVDHYEIRSNNIVPDGYATVGRKHRLKGHHSTPSLGTSCDTGLFQLIQNNGLNEQKFLAHSLALSSNQDTIVPPPRPDKLKLSQTVHALPQHEIQVQHARTVYLKQAQPLSQTQPSSNYAISQSLPVTPLSEDVSSCTTQSGSSTPDLDRQKLNSSSNNNQYLSNSLNSSLNSSNDASIDVQLKVGSSSKSPLQTITESFGGLLKTRHKSGTEQPQPRLLRSNSTPNVLEATEDEDIDQDDYGFLTYRSFRSKNHPFKPSDSSSDMQKAKTSDSLVQGRSSSKKWKKPKVTQTKSAPVSVWKPLGHCTWSSTGGKRLVLTPSHLLHMAEQERLALQKISHSKLQNMGLGCQVVIPKESRAKRTKSRVFTLKKRSSSGGLLDRSKDGKDPLSTGWVFGNSLSKVICNDKDLGHGCPCPLRDRRDSIDLTRPERKSSSSSGCGISTESLSESDSRSTGSTLLDALSLSSAGKGDVSKDHEPSLQPHTPRVPYIVHCCFKHLETHGVNTIGIFRIGSSKKRVKQLREEFDSGNEVQLGEDWSPHDVAALLKEFFRDLPDPLLTRDLYTAFLATCKLKDVNKRIDTLRLLVTLLPPASRDTLFALLRFLNVVVEHSSDNINQYGQQVAGNKMDCTNLATIFGPNILHKSKGGEFQVESVERLEQRTDVIAVIKDMLDNYVQIFELPPDLEDEVFRSMLESNPEFLDVLLRRKCQIQGMDMDGESSSMCEEDSLSASQNSDAPPNIPTSKPRTLSEAVAMQQEQQQQITSKESRNHQRPRTFNEALVMPKQQHNVHTYDSSVNSQPQHTHSVQRRERISSAKEMSSPQKQQHVSLKQMFRLSTPDPIIHTRESPHVSPSPKAMKPATPNLRIRLTPDSPSPNSNERTNFLSSAKAFLSPRTSRKKEEDPAPKSNSNLLTVPSTDFVRTNSSRDNKNASNSSLSSGYFGGSSRSGTTSPVSPEMLHHHTSGNSSINPHSSSNNKWYSSSLETPPQTPPSGEHIFDFSSKHTSQDPSFIVSSPFQRTSSLSRPLGVSRQSSTPSSPSLPHWQAERWRHWQEVTRQRSDETQEQETLV